MTSQLSIGAGEMIELAQGCHRLRAISEINQRMRTVAQEVRVLADGMGQVAEATASSTVVAQAVVTAAGDLSIRAEAMNRDIDTFVAQVGAGARSL